MSQDDEWEQYYQPGSDVLANRIGATSHEQLARAEATFVPIRMQELRHHPIEATFDRAHMSAIHEHLFQDIYPFAGHTRVGGEMAKHALDVLAVPRDPAKLRVYTYADTIDLDAKLDHAYARLRAADNLRGLGHADFVTGLADHWNEINELHQFREGNTRSQAVFFDQLAHHAGYTFNNHLMASPHFRESFNRARFHYQATSAQGTATSDRLAQVLSQVIEQQPRKASAATQAFPTKLTGSSLAAAAANPTRSAAAGKPPPARTRPSTVPAR